MKCLRKPNLIRHTVDKLGTGIEQLSENASQLSDLTGAASATSDFTVMFKRPQILQEFLVNQLLVMLKLLAIMLMHFKQQ